MWKLHIEATSVRLHCCSHGMDDAVINVLKHPHLSIGSSPMLKAKIRYSDICCL